jgi:hypothetical protein
VRLADVVIGHVAKSPINPTVWNAYSDAERTDLIGQRSTRELAAAALAREFTHREEVLARFQHQTVPVPDRWPVNARQLVAAAAVAGWSATVNHAPDVFGFPYLVVYVAEPGPLGRQFNADWHTRATEGRDYQLFSCSRWEGIEQRDVTIWWALAEVQTAGRQAVAR